MISKIYLSIQDFKVILEKIILANSILAFTGHVERGILLPEVNTDHTTVKHIDFILKSARCMKPKIGQKEVMGT